MFYTMYSECTHTSASVVMESVFKLETGTGRRLYLVRDLRMLYNTCTHTYSVHTQNTLPSDSTQLGAFPKAFQLTCSSNTRICCSALPVLDQFSPHCYTDDSLSPATEHLGRYVPSTCQGVRGTTTTTVTSTSARSWQELMFWISSLALHIAHQLLMALQLAPAALLPSSSSFSKSNNATESELIPEPCCLLALPGCPSRRSVA